MTPAARIIALLLCDRCGHDTETCTCRPADPAALAAEVAARHQAAVQLAHRHNDCRRRYPAWNRT